MSDRPALTDLQKVLIAANPRPAVGCIVLWRGYLCRVVPTPTDYGPMEVMVRRYDGWMDIASTVGLEVPGRRP